MNGFDSVKPAEDIEFQAIPNGDYVVKCSNYSLDQAKDPWRATFEFTIADGDFKDRKVFANYQVNEKGGPFLKKDMRLMGVTDDINSDNLLAQMCIAAQKQHLYDAYIKQREYNGKTYYNLYLNGIAQDAVNSPPGIDKNDELGF